MSEHVTEKEMRELEKRGEGICAATGIHAFDQTPNGRLIAEVRRLRAKLEAANKAAAEWATAADTAEKDTARLGAKWPFGTYICFGMGGWYWRLSKNVIDWRPAKSLGEAIDAARQTEEGK